MVSAFDNDGIAKSDVELTVYDYDPQTGEFAGSFIWKCLKGTGLPAHATTLEPPKFGYGKNVRFKNGGWEVVDDHRGKVMHSTTTLESFVIDKIGAIPDGFTLEDPTSVWDEWIKGKWVLNETKRSESIYQANLQLRKDKVNEAAQIIDALSDLVDDDSMPPAAVRMHQAWKKYRSLLMLVNLADPSWPDEPSHDMGSFILPEDSKKSGEVDANSVEDEQEEASAPESSPNEEVES